MIRLLTRWTVPRGSPWRWLLHPDPESLAELGRCLSKDSGEAPELAARFSRVVGSIRVGDVHKFTGPGRLRESDEALADALSARGLRAVALLDVGASDGTTALDTVRLLSERLALPVRATLIDRTLRLLRYGNGWLQEYRSPDGTPVMVRLGPLGLQLSSVESTRDPLSRWLGRRYLRREGPRARMPLAATLDLVNPAVRRAGLRVLEADILERQESLLGAFDAIRASNVLNLDYFPPPSFAQALEHLHSYLAAEGILIVSRNHHEEGGRECGSVWRRTEAGFARLRDFGGGSYVAALVDDFRPPPCRGSAHT